MWRDFKELARGVKNGRVRERARKRGKDRQRYARRIKARCVRKLTVMNVFYIY